MFNQLLALCTHFRRDARAIWAPGHCVLCRAGAPPGRDLCAGCLADLPTIGCGCPRCGLPLAGVRDDPQGTAVPCGRCLRGSPAFPSLFAAPAFAFRTATGSSPTTGASRSIDWLAIGTSFSLGTPFIIVTRFVCVTFPCIT